MDFTQQTRPGTEGIDIPSAPEAPAAPLKPNWAWDPAGSGLRYNANADPNAPESEWWRPPTTYETTAASNNVLAGQAAEELRRWNAERAHLEEVDRQNALDRQNAEAHRNAEMMYQLDNQKNAIEREKARLALDTRDSYAKHSGFMYAMPGEPALPNVSYQQNYIPPAPLPPGFRVR